jgi:endonuclease YncB( thermonuclease family)
LDLLTIHNCTYVAPTSVRNELDGDTFRCQGDVSPIIPDSKVWVPKVRVVRINAPESGQPGAQQAREALTHWLTQGKFNLVCYGRDKYGRLLADAEAGAGRLISEYMLLNGLAVPMTVAKARDLLVEHDEDLLRAISRPSS